MSAGWKKNVQLREALRQFAPELGDVRGRGRMLPLQRDQDLAIHRSDRCRVAQRDVDAAIGQADVVEDHVDLVVADDIADGVLDLREILLGLLDPCAGRGADVQAHLPGVDLREEIHAKPREQGKRGADDDHEEGHGGRGPVHHPGQCIAMPLA